MSENKPIEMKSARYARGFCVASSVGHALDTMQIDWGWKRGYAGCYAPDGMEVVAIGDNPLNRIYGRPYETAVFLGYGFAEARLWRQFDEYWRKIGGQFIYHPDQVYKEPPPPTTPSVSIWYAPTPAPGFLWEHDGAALSKNPSTPVPTLEEALSKEGTPTLQARRRAAHILRRGLEALVMTRGEAQEVLTVAEWLKQEEIQ